MAHTTCLNCHLILWYYWKVVILFIPILQTRRQTQREQAVANK